MSKHFKANTKGYKDDGHEEEGDLCGLFFVVREFNEANENFKKEIEGNKNEFPFALDKCLCLLDHFIYLM